MPDLPVNFSWTRFAADIYITMCSKAADGMREAGGFGEADKWRSTGSILTDVTRIGTA
jgi:hypothetical protein